MTSDAVTTPDRDVIASMCNTIMHRGPNDEGIFVDGRIGLGMRRLSVIDLQKGQQPLCNEDGTVWVVFNGEIYNYRELGKELRERGHSFRSASDTEVIVHLYEEYGDSCVDHLRGMFAFAIWDSRRGHLLLARDRLGVKPLYYFWDGRNLIFGSEMKAILAHPSIETTVSIEGLLYYLRYCYIPDPLTAFRFIKKLPPAAVATLENGRFSIRTYWNGNIGLEEHGAIRDEQALMGHLEALLKEAVSIRLISEVPIGAFLSGGLDSSLIAALMAKELEKPVQTFSIGFEDSCYNELPFARAVAKHIGAEHHELVLGPQDCSLAETIIRHFDEPFGDASAIPTFLLSKMAAGQVTVCLSGDGGDEIFAGYDRYKIEVARVPFDRLPGIIRRALRRSSDLLPEGFYGKNFMRNISLPAHGRYLDSLSYVSTSLAARLISPDLAVGFGSTDDIMMKYCREVEGNDRLSQLQYIDTKTYMPGDILTKVDRMSMAHSLEVRNPLLDHVLYEYVAKLPPQMKLHNGASKYVLKRVAEKYLPASIVHRRKQGFAVPLELWFGKGLRSYFSEILFDSKTKQRGIVNVDEVERLVKRYESGRHEVVQVLWLLVVLELWFRLYVDGMPQSAVLSGNASRVSADPRKQSCRSLLLN